MRVLWVSEVVPDPNSGAGGTELLMVQQLRALGHEVDTIWADDLPRRIAHGNLHYAFELPVTYARAIQQAVAQQAYDVVTVNLGQSYLAARRLRSDSFPGAFIVRSHGLDDHLNEVLQQWSKSLDLPKRSVIKSAFSNALSGVMNEHIHKATQVCDGYVVSNSLDAEYLSRRHGLSDDRIAVIPQAPADPFFGGPAPAMSADRLKRMLYVAGYHFAKGPHAVAAAAQKLLASDENLSLTWICHPNDHPQVESLLGPMRERVHLLGWMSQEELVSQFDSHGVFLYPSLFDGFGKIFLEAMARGLCVVGTRAGGMVDIIRDDENGFLCSFNEPKELIDRVRRLQAKRSLAEQMSASAAETAREYSWERVGRELAEFFQDRLKAAHGELHLEVAAS